MRYVTDASLGDCLLLDDLPDFRFGVNTSHECPAESERGLTGRERRVARSSGRMRTGQWWTLAALSAAAAGDAIEAMQAYQAEPVLFPFWPGETAAGATPKYSSTRWLWLSSAGATTVAAAAPDVGEAVMGWPLLAGRFTERPAMRHLTTEDAPVSLACVENDPAGALAAVGPTFPTGPGGLPVLDIFPGGESAEGGLAFPAVTWTEHGPSLTARAEFYAEQPARQLACEFKLTDAPAMLAFFAARGGSVGAFWTPTWLATTRLASDAAAAATSLAVVDIAPLNLSAASNRALALSFPPTLEVVSAIAGAGNNVTVSALANAWAASSTLVSTAIRARFSRTALELSWSSPELATARVAFTELVDEYAPADGETLGVSIGDSGLLVHLFTFTRRLPDDSTTTYRHTDAAASVVHGGNTYTHLPLRITGEIVHSLNLDADTMTLEVTSRDGADPLALALLDGDGVWTVTVSEYNGTSAAVIFAGELRGPSAQGPNVRAEVVRLGGIGERPIPAVVVQPRCNYAVYSAACGLSKATWAFTGTTTAAAAAGDATLTVTASAPGVAGTAWQAANWFTGGNVITGGRGYRIRASSYAAGVLTLTLAGTLRADVANGAALAFHRGCDGRSETCEDVFDNYARFGGFPFLPVGNPALGRVKVATGGSKK